MPTAAECLEKRNTAITACRDIKAKADAEKRSLSAEERTAFDAAGEDVRKWNGEYKEQHADDERGAWLNKQLTDLDTSGERITDPKEHAGKGKGAKAKLRRFAWNARSEPRAGLHTRREIVCRSDRMQTLGSRAYSEAHHNYLIGASPARAFKGLEESHLIPNDKYRNVLRSDDEGRGGYFVPPIEFMAGILKTVDDQTYVKSLARNIMVPHSRELGIRKRLQKANAWAHGSELEDITEHFEDSLRYGKRVLTPHYISGGALISNDLLRMAADINIESELMLELGIDLSEFMENDFLYGDGAQKPLGVMVADSEGISTARDTVLGATTTAFTFDAFQQAKYLLKKKYRENARWMFHRTFLAAVAVLKESTGAYLWQPSRQVGEPDRILGLPFDESEWMPSTAGASLYYCLLADWRFYYVAIGLDMEMRRLTELSARQNMTEYHMRMKYDGMPVLEEAFIRMKFAAA